MQLQIADVNNNVILFFRSSLKSRKAKDYEAQTNDNSWPMDKLASDNKSMNHQEDNNIAT